LSAETYGIRGHSHGEQVDDLAPPVRLEHIAGEKAVVDGCGVVVSTMYVVACGNVSSRVMYRHTRVLVLLQLGQLRLANVHHDCCGIDCTARRVQGRVVGLSVERRVALFCLLLPILAGFLLAFSLVGTNFNKLDSGDVNPLTRANPNHTHQCM
jgi:hypothetical protein